VNHIREGTILGHPKGLFVLFFTEMWERFSYYGMRALLVLYLVNIFKMTQEDASFIYKWYTALVYLTPLAGGYLADRYLGNKWAIVIGSILMAIGQFILATGERSFLMFGLGFLIVGNGFFKPNMSVQVGRLYPQNDPRRDGAYTIFYMGINLGAFFAPIICGALMDTPGLGYGWGFAAAGVGMILGLLIYLFGLPWIKELPEGVQYQGPPGETGKKTVEPVRRAMTEEEARTAASVLPGISHNAPVVLSTIGVVLILVVISLSYFGIMKGNDALAFGLGLGAACFAGAWVTSKIQAALRDRVLAIFVLAVFVIFFWAAFEQAGNAMNVWADQTTNRYLTDTPPTPSVYPGAYVAAKELGFGGIVKEAFAVLVRMNPVLTTSFQSINALAIVLLAPLFAWLWVFLSNRNISPSIATKMATGVFLQGVAFALMIWSVKYENGPSETKLAKLPDTVVKGGDETYFYDAPTLEDDKAYQRFQSGSFDQEHDKMIAHGGRLVVDESQGVLRMRGVLDANHRDRILRATAPKDYVKFVWDMASRSKELKKASDSDGAKLEVKIDRLPPGFDAQYLKGFNPSDLRFDESTNTFLIGKELADQDYKQLLVAGANPEFRTALNDLWVQSTKYRVSSSWLLWFYVLCTLGELCVSPVGLSMVSKLAPRRFATMLMGMWMLTSFFGNYTAGLAGENWEKLDPSTYFTYVTIAMAAAAFVCYLIARKVTSMMHGVT